MLSKPLCLLCLTWASLLVAPAATGTEDLAPLVPFGRTAPLELPDTPIYRGEIRFLDEEAGKLYRDGLEALRTRLFSRARTELKKGLRRVKDDSEKKILGDLLAEAEAGVELDKTTSRLERSTSKRAQLYLLRALNTLEKELPDLEGRILEEEYRFVIDQIRDFLYLVIEDFEPAEEKGSGGEEGAGDEKEAEPEDDDEEDDPGRGGRGRRNPFGGRRGNAFLDALKGGELQGVDPDPTRVRQGKFSYRWPVGEEIRVLRYKVDGKRLKEFGTLNLSVRGSSRTSSRFRVYLLHEGTNLTRLYISQNDFRGFSADLVVQGTRWKDHRLRLGKELRPHDEPELERIEEILIVARKQSPSQVLYLDDIKLER